MSQLSSQFDLSQPSQSVVPKLHESHETYDDYH